MHTITLSHSIAYSGPLFNNWKVVVMAKKQKSGLYRTKVKIGVNPDGSPLFKYISGKTKRELEEVRAAVINHYISGNHVAEDRLFGSCAIDWFERMKAKFSRNEISASTLQSYRTALNRDILPVFGARNMRAIQPGELQRFVESFSGMSQTKITYVTAALKSIFRSACTENILQRNPFDNIEKPTASETAEKRALTSSERRRVKVVSKYHPDGPYLACMYYLGARPGEIRGLQWGDFDWKKNLVHIQRDIDYKLTGPQKVGSLKNSKSNRFVPVPNELRLILYPLRNEPDSFVFEGPVSKSHLSKTSAERLWLRLMMACRMVTKLPEGSNKYRSSDPRSRYQPIITPHCMRHNYVTMCFENDIDVYTASKLAGHKSIKTTMDIYTHLSEKQLANAARDVHAMFSKK